MQEARGKLPKGSTGILTLSDGIITLWEERGLIKKRRVKVAEFTLAETTSIQLGKGEPPFRKMHRLAMGYVAEGLEGGEGDVAFFSYDASPLEAIKDEIDREIERRRAAQESERRERRRIREAHVRHLTLLLELLDNVFQIIFELDGSVNWSLMDKHRLKVEEIGEEMEEIGDVKPIDVSVGGLSSSIQRRLTDDIKKGCYSLIEAVHEGSEEMSSQLEGRSDAFNLELYRPLVRAYLLLWDLKLGEFLDKELKKDELEELQACLEELSGTVGLEVGDQSEENAEFLLSSETGLSFFTIRSLIRRYLGHLVD